MTNELTVEEEIVQALRGIIRGVDHHSRQLYHAVGLTWPQLATLRAASRLGPCSLSRLAKEMRLSQATLSGIIHRLESAGFIERRPHDTDGRSTAISVTSGGLSALQSAPSLLQDRFRAELGKLKDWERLQTLASLKRIAEMMDVDTADASPILAIEPIPGPAPSGPETTFEKTPDSRVRENKNRRRPAVGHTT
ncbi:MAG: MarR family transcriptional regulator [Phycisphaerae bacterium]|nr:MarR family transcriptional regulator [Phycisphaerae bacterium]